MVLKFQNLITWLSSLLVINVKHKKLNEKLKDLINGQ